VSFPADGAVLAASRREHALYGELLRAYRELAAALAEEAVPPDARTLAAAHASAEETTRALRALAAELAPHRLSGDAVAGATRALWRESAELAAEASRLNAECLRAARARQAAVGARLAGLDTGRRALDGYRPAAVPAPQGPRA
jgi:hypothetical protein